MSSENTPPPQVAYTQIVAPSNGMTLEKVGIIAALLISIVNAGFVFGVMYSQVSENTKFRETSQIKLEMQGQDLAAIKTSLEYLVDRDKEARQKDADR